MFIAKKQLLQIISENDINCVMDVNGNIEESFEPQIIPKYQRDISAIEEIVISLYVREV